MKNTVLFMILTAFVLTVSSLTAQIQTGVFRTPAGNTDYHQFTRNSSGAAVFINQESTNGPQLTVVCKFIYKSIGLFLNRHSGTLCRAGC